MEEPVLVQETARYTENHKPSPEATPDQFYLHFGQWIGPKLLRIQLSIDGNNTLANSDILFKQLIMT